MERTRSRRRVNRNGNPRHPIDRELIDVRATWGPDARIDITEDDDGNFIVTVLQRADRTHYREGGWTPVDTRKVPQ
jgi:hypothetical protein